MIRTNKGHSIVFPVSLFAGTFLLLALPLFANAQTELTGADAECVPAIVNNCGCGRIVDPKTGECINGTNKYQCICSQPDPGGGSTTGTCDATEKCHTITTNGKSPQLPTAQQQQVNAGTSGGSAGEGSPQVTNNQAPALPQETPPQTSEQTASNPNSSVPTGSPLWQDALNAYESLTGQNNPSAPIDNTGAPVPQSNTEPSWLSGAQQSQISNELSPSSGNSPTNVISGGTPSGEQPTFQSSQTSSNNLFTSQDLQDIKAANALVTPQGVAVQAVQSIAQDVGGWIQSTLYPTDQSSLTGQQTTPQDTTDVRSTIYTPGTGGDNGGLYGSHDNYLNPNTPTVAAGFSSPYQYGDVLSITNPGTGQTINAVVGDTCPACGTGIDLTPAAANPIGFTMEQGVGTMQVGVVASTGSYAAGAQVASALNGPSDPWSGSSASQSSVSTSNLSGVATVNDYADSALASTQYTNDQIAAANAANAQEAVALDSNSNRPIGELSSANTGEAISAQPEAIPTGVVENGGALPEPAPSSAFAQIGNTEQNGLSGGVASNDQIFSNQQTPGAQFAEAGPANPAGVVQNGGELPEPGVPNPSGIVEQGPAIEQPISSANVTSEPLPLTNQQIEAQVPVPDTSNLPTGDNITNQFLNAAVGSANLEATPNGVVENGGELAPVFAPISGNSIEGGLSGGLASNDQIFSNQPTPGATAFESIPEPEITDIAAGFTTGTTPIDISATDIAGGLTTGATPVDVQTTDIAGGLTTGVTGGPVDISATDIAGGLNTGISAPIAESPEVTTVPAEVPTPEQVVTNPQAEVEAANLTDNLKFDALNLDNPPPTPGSSNNPINTNEPLSAQTIPPVFATGLQSLSSQTLSAASDSQLPSWASLNPGSGPLSAQNLESPVSPQSLQQQLAGGFSPGGEVAEPIAGNAPLPTSRPSDQIAAQQAAQTQPTNPSVVDYLNGMGQNASYLARSALAESFGIAHYVGSAVQNLQLLTILRNLYNNTRI